MSPSTTWRFRRHQRFHSARQKWRLHSVNVRNRPQEEKENAFLPVEFNTVKIDALVDSGAYINAISERDAEKLRQNASQCIVNRAPPTPFKVQYANAELEQPLATYTLRFKIGDYTFEETFIILNQTSFPIIGIAFLRKHAAILDTAQGTIDFPKIQITMALREEMQKGNPMPMTIKTEAKHTIPAHSTRTFYASIPVSTEHWHSPYHSSMSARNW